MKRIQIEFIGRGEIKNTPAILRENSAKKIFLITGNQSYQTCGAKYDIDRLLHNYNLVRFHDFSPNPNFDEALKGAKLFEKEECDFIIAIGGGSAIDMAKTINVFQAHKGKEKELATGKIKPVNHLAPTCIIPTTSGTGSEATHFAVIYVDGNKYSLAGEALLPDYVILDPRYTDILSPYITACTGFDALSQAIESYWAKNATADSRKFASKAIVLLIKNIERAVNDSNTSSRDKMLIGANYAGKAINISKTTAPHALSYTITSITGIPHGHAVALTLGNFFTLHEEKCLPEDVQICLRALYSLLNVASPKAAQTWWYSLMVRCGLETDLSSFRFSRDQLAKIVDSVNIERLSNHPVILNKEDLCSILK
ncbi:MAG: phosphonoacetaldehyde reductase [Emcibacter sp.]|nr:phosphonoacetaldehyde reductase [Emcibacter sp.]